MTTTLNTTAVTMTDLTDIILDYLDLDLLEDRNEYGVYDLIKSERISFYEARILRNLITDAMNS